MGTTDNTGQSDFQPVFENRVRFAETDQQGIVFYGEYFTFQDEAVSQLFRDIDYDYDRMHEDGWQVHVANTELNYRNAAEFGDVIVNELRVAEIGTASFTVDYRAKRAADDQLLVDGSVTHVAVDLETERPTRVPDAFREGVTAFQGGLPDS
ncbi:acyl-CoA thioesterase [Natronorubrum aibiense]|uniref:YbgC/FadM family acyl-CoA thioesterase n=1 Tax=Natronorubrum aibiense TaxID=348826 RepID=A0A5P9P582_9EURY|nr:thioesterase family protein [Natronorubrum aibiense]QFU83288.1 YbgC/FadM family acyl-CoA thioesterase [Natronorubrum aibiense]